MVAVSPAKQAALTAERLREILHYDPETGFFTWLIKPSRKIALGSLAGSASANGYRVIRVDGNLYQAHRLAWFYVHGRWPIAEIDHINRDKAENRLINLREATRPQNMHNTLIRSSNKTGFVGVSMAVVVGKFQAHYRRDGKRFYLGTFATAEAASAAYRAAIAYRGEFLPTAA